MLDPGAAFDRADTHPKSLDTFDPTGAFEDVVREVGEIPPAMKDAAAEMSKAVDDMAKQAGFGGKDADKGFDPSGDFDKAARGERVEKPPPYADFAPLEMPDTRPSKRPISQKDFDADLKTASNNLEAAKAARTQRDTTGPLKEVSGALGEVGMHKEAGKVNEAVDMVETVGRAASGDPIAMVKLAKKAADEVKERAAALYEGAKGAGREGFNALSSDRAGDVISHGAAAGEHLAHGTARAAQGTPLEPLAKAGEQVFKFGRVVGDSLEGLRKWNDQLFDGNVRFAEFSGAMTQVQVEQELRAMDVSRQRGDAQADSARQQAEAKARLDKALQPFETWWANFTNKISAKVSDKGAVFLNAFGLADEEDPENQEAAQRGRAVRENLNPFTGIWDDPNKWADNWAERFGLRDKKGPGGVG